MGSQKNRSFSLSHAALVNAALAALLLSSTASAQTPGTAPQVSTLAAPLPQAAAKKTVTQTVTFSASHQNYWGGAFADTHRLELFGSYPNGTITFEPPFSTDFSFDTSNSGLPLTFIGGLSNSRLGLTLNAYATAGDVSVNYPGSLALTLDPQLTPNTNFSFATSFARDPQNSNLSITPPGFDATLGGLVAGNMKLSGTFHTPSKFPNIDFNAFNTSVNTTFDIFNVQKDLVAPLEAYGGLNTPHDLGDFIPRFPKDILKFEVDDPRVVNFTNNSAVGSSLLSYAGYQQFLNLNGDISNLIGYLGYSFFTDGQSLPHGIFNADYNYVYSKDGFGGGIDITYQLADLHGDMPLGFQQNFTFQASPKTTITLFGPNGKQIGQPVTVSVGGVGSIPVSNFYADGTPVLVYGVTSVPITVQSSLDFSSNTLHNDTNLQWKPGLYFEPYSLSASGYIEAPALGSYSKSVLFAYSPGPIALATKTFTFNALSHDTTIGPGQYSVSPSVITSTINYVGTSIDQPHPALSGMSQTSDVIGTNVPPLTLTGTGFTNKSQAVVAVSGVTGVVQQTLNAKYISPTSLQVTLPPSDLKTPATLSLSVFNPGLPTPTTYNSNALPFLVALPGCYLNAAAAFQQPVPVSGPVSLSVVLANNSTVDAADVRLSSAVLDGVKPSVGAIIGLGTIKSGASAKPVFYSFPVGALPAAGPARLVLSGTISGKPFTLTVPIAVPANLTAIVTEAGSGLKTNIPTALSLVLKNASQFSASAVVIKTVQVNGKDQLFPYNGMPTLGTALPLTVGTLAAGASSPASGYVFQLDASTANAKTAQLVVTGTQNGTAFTTTTTIPINTPAPVFGP